MSTSNSKPSQIMSTHAHFKKKKNGFKCLFMRFDMTMEIVIESAHVSKLL